MKELLVPKVGTSTVLDENGLLDQRQFNSIADQLAEVGHMYDFAIVSSGAVSAGAEEKGEKREDYVDDIAALQYFASIGQSLLTERWREAFRPYGKAVGQCLITRYELGIEWERGPFINTIGQLIEAADVPIINENDAVATEELRVGDNDMIAAMAAVAISSLGLWSNCVVLELTDVDGVYRDYGTSDQRLIKEISDISKFRHVVEDNCDSIHGTGGMGTKFDAAEYANKKGISFIIANGKAPRVISSALIGKTGTRIQSY